MKCTNKFLFTLFLLPACLLPAGCGGKNYDLAYSPDYAVSSYRLADNVEEAAAARPFAADLCVVSQDIMDDGQVDMSKASSAALFKPSSQETLYAKNVYEQLYPASLTKVMTALVALKHGSLDEVLTASANVKIQESGAQVCGLKEGDKMTLDQALHVMLINSANDAAVLIAEGIGGSIESFAGMMNEEAKAIGATNSHFVNPHGLSDNNHFVTAYDMYLIFNEAMKLGTFTQIINMDSYSTVYEDKNGNSKELSVKSTNLYFQGLADVPENLTVVGGKTGTTNAAGHCLILLTKDTSGTPYISVILQSEGRDLLYSQMTQMLGQIQK